ncbi:MAG: glycosyltransferase, partial [Anaerolineales bacterium]|nr:glycosyltransferase [Anaerolineales bacterium]
QGGGGAVISGPAVAASPPIAAAETPLISCIMPTSLARLDYVRQAIAYFRRQTYANLELIVVDDGPEPIAPHLPADDRIRTLRLPPGQSIGAKRNRACEAARGSIIAHWDDDDWYAPRRLAAQAAPLLSGAADVCGLAGSLFFDLPGWAFWAVTPALHQRLFVGNVHGGTLVYRRAVWQELAQFPNRSLAEDAAFLQRATRRGARLHRLPNDGLFLYLRHGDNSWAFTCGQHVDPGGWQRIVEPPFLAADRAFYAARRGNGAPDAAGPLVSCIMPTADRRAFVPRAIACFLRQEYAHRELIILDDGVESVADLVPADARIRYERLPRRLRVGEKRNLACEAARGDVIAHWDDDDWYASWRLGYQAAQLQAAGADVCGLDRVLYWDAAAERAWLYVYPPRGRPWVAGNTLCYPRAFWQRNPFQAIDVGEDARFVWSQQAQRVLPLPDHRFCVAWIHAGNVSPKRPSGSRWQPAAAAEVHALLGGDTTHGLARHEIAAASFRRAVL